MNQRDRHAAVWSAIDQIAAQLETSPSGLARRAGLDPTAFNKSKRIGDDGAPRWPSLGTLSLVLEVSGTTYADFEAFVDELLKGRE